MEVFAEIREEISDLHVIHQDKYAFVISESHECILNLTDGSQEDMTLDGEPDSILNAFEGDMVGSQGIELSEETAERIKEIGEDESEGYPKITDSYKLQKCNASQSDFDEMKRWPGSPTLWRLEVHSIERGRLITGEEDPIIIRWNNYCYIFAINFDKTLKIYRCSLAREN